MFSKFKKIMLSLSNNDQIVYPVCLMFNRTHVLILPAAVVEVFADKVNNSLK